MSPDSAFTDTLPPQHLAADEVQELRRQRLRQILLALMAAYALVIATNLATGLAGRNVVLELIGIALFAVAYRFNQRGDLLRAAWITMGSLMVVLSSLMFVGQGLFDEVPMAFPGILVMALMFGSGRVFLATLAAMLAVLAAMYALHATGVLHAAPRPLEISRLLVMTVILCVTAYFVFIITVDLRRLMEQQEADKQALAVSHLQIAELAYRDSLTRLPNRALAMERLAHMLTQARRGQDLIAVMFLDLDNFKTINDSLGHAAGDELLRQVADRLQSCLRTSDTVARLSGDEFLLLLGQLRDEAAITATAAKVMEQLAPAFNLRGTSVHASGSLGIAVSPRDGTEIDVLLKSADLAMYQAKDAGRNTFRFFDAGMNASMLEHLHLATGLRTALTEGALRLYYQPQLHLGSGRVVGAEALLRWHHPELGWLSPARFIPIAERSGLIHELGNWVLHQACADARQWREQGLQELRVAVNISPLQFRRGNLEQEVAHALALHALPAQCLELEITESVLMDDSQRLSGTLQHLHRLGVQIAIDDFGTGYSNLGYLQRYAVHRLKIDQSFVRQMGSGAQAEGIVRAIIEIAHCLGLQVVGEGIESAAVLAQLRAFGCEMGQGFHWSPAVTAEQFVAFVHQHQG